MAALKQIDMAALRIPRSVRRHHGLRSANSAIPTWHILRSGLGHRVVEDGARGNGCPIIAPKKQKA
jgi:hypothetical protein